MRAAAVVACLLGVSPARADITFFSSDTPHDGIRREVWKDDNPARKVVLRMLAVDLSSAEIGLVATAQPDRGKTTSQFATSQGAVAAINGDLFAVADYKPDGLAVGLVNNVAAQWTTASNNQASSVFHFARVGEQTIATIDAASGISLSTMPPETQGAISGRPVLVTGGAAVTQFDQGDVVVQPYAAMPRSALGLSQDGIWLYLVVVDGWQAASAGVALPELAGFLQARGAYTAFALDSGGSSTLVLDGQVISSPSDFVERSVANHLAVRYHALPRGELFGFVCKDSVNGCGDDSARWIYGADVWLDDGRYTRGSSTNGTYDFTGVTQRFACVTVKKSGYLTAHKCTDYQIVPNTMNYNSVAMIPGVDPIDASVPDGSYEGHDARMTGPRPDAGNPGTGPGGGCCDAGDAPPPIALCALVALFLTRRRGTTG